MRRVSTQCVRRAFVSLDYGGNLFVNNLAKFLEISVRPAASTGAFTTLGPRQQFTAAPYAVQSGNADKLDGVAANQYVLTTDPRQPSGNFVQNGTTQQASANFNISGNGTAGGTLSGGTVNAATQFNLNGNRLPRQ